MPVAAAALVATLSLAATAAPAHAAPARSCAVDDPNISMVVRGVRCTSGIKIINTAHTQAQHGTLNFTITVAGGTRF